MISFIIIGYNERWKLSKCLQSVKETIKYNNVSDAEIIYVDSKSTDDSITTAKKTGDVKVFLITGKCNAAVARNTGATEAKGDILFFIDGDMEIEKEFLPQAIENGKLKYDFVSGHIDDYLYDPEDTFLGIEKRTYKGAIPEEKQILKSNGGIFITKREIWDKAGGMSTKYKLNEDVDLSYRLSKAGIKIVRLPYLICKHHTIGYNHEYRMWSEIKNIDYHYAAIFIRNHFFSSFTIKRFARNFYTEILFILTCISIFFGKKVFIFVFFLYLFALLLRSFKHTLETFTAQNKIFYFFGRVLYQFIWDILFWFSFFFVYPKNVEIKYKKVPRDG